MKEATGELSMTVVTIIAILAVLGIVVALRRPMVEYIQKRWNSMVDKSDAADDDNQYNDGWNTGN